MNVPLASTAALILADRFCAANAASEPVKVARRAATTLTAGGIATNKGVESRAWAVREHGFAPVLRADAATSRSADMHAFAFEMTVPLRRCVGEAEEIELRA